VGKMLRTGEERGFYHNLYACAKLATGGRGRRVRRTLCCSTGEKEREASTEKEVGACGSVRHPVAWEKIAARGSRAVVNTTSLRQKEISGERGCRRMRRTSSYAERGKKRGALVPFSEPARLRCIIRFADGGGGSGNEKKRASLAGREDKRLREVWRRNISSTE